MAKTLVLDGIVVDPSQGIHHKMDILIEDGRIADLQPQIPMRLAETVIDAKGLTVTPGFIDLHTHLREPGGESSETIESGTRAAAAGGFTTIFCMPNTNPICDTSTGVQYVISRATAMGLVNVIPVAAITKGQNGEEFTNFGLLQSAGAGAFSDDGRPVMNSEIMRRALEYTKMLGVPIFEHCEDMNLTGGGVMNEGRTSISLGLRGIPRTSESVMVSRNVALAQATGGHIHICHVSTRESVEAIREAKRSGVHVTAEVSPHHLTMTETAVVGYNANAKMKPPLCEEEDRLALLAALEDGTIDCIATDHAPHSINSKLTVFDLAPFGIIGLESAFPLLYTEFVAPGRWSLDFLVEKLTIGPAGVMKERWGTLKPGAKADLVLLQLDKPYTFTEDNLRSKSRNCPWLGQKMLARIAATFVSGRMVFEAPGVLSKKAPVADAPKPPAARKSAKPSATKKAQPKRRKK